MIPSKEAIEENEVARAERFKPGSLGCHEALHMAAFLSAAVNEELTTHPAIEANAEWRRLAAEAENLLVKLYSEIGKIHLAT